eukprot:5152840-Pleurochrysis_carterae.AAC.2
MMRWRRWLVMAGQNIRLHAWRQIPVASIALLQCSHFSGGVANLTLPSLLAHCSLCSRFFLTRFSLSTHALRRCARLPDAAANANGRSSRPAQARKATRDATI